MKGHKSRLKKVDWINLGTTSCYVSVIEGGDPSAVTNPEGFRTNPSVVSFTKTKKN